MPIGGDANLDHQKTELKASLIEGLNTDFGKIISDEIFVKDHKISNALCIVIPMSNHYALHAKKFIYYSGSG